MGKHLLCKTISYNSKPSMCVSKNLSKFPLFIVTAAILRRCADFYLVIPSGCERR